MLVAALILRALPAIQGRVLFSADRDYHLSYVELLRSTKHRIPRQDPGILGPGELTYPYGYHRLLSYLPAGAIPWLDRFSAVVFDLVVAVGATALLRQYGGLSPARALAITGCYLLVPGLSLLHHGPRAFSLTPRSFSQALVAGSVLLLGWHPHVGSFVPVALAAVGLTFAVTSSKFSLQFSLFVLPIAALLAWDARPVLALAVALVLAPLVSGGYFVRQFRGQVAHLRWYARRNQGFIMEKRGGPAFWRQIRDRDFAALGATLLNRNVVTSALVREPIVFVAAGRFALDRPQASSLVWFGCVATTALVPYVVTSVGRARVLGEAERYLEFAIPAAWVFFWGTIGREYFALSLGLVGAWVVLVYALNLWLLYRRALATPAQISERARLREFLAGAGPCVVLCLDASDVPIAINRPHEVKVCTVHGWTSGRDVDTFLSRVFRRFPYVDPDALSDLVAEYRVNYLLARVDTLQRVDKTLGIRYRLPEHDAVFDGESYQLYRCSPAKKESMRGGEVVRD